MKEPLSSLRELAATFPHPPALRSRSNPCRTPPWGGQNLKGAEFFPMGEIPVPNTPWQDHLRHCWELAAPSHGECGVLRACLEGGEGGVGATPGSPTHPEPPPRRPIPLPIPRNSNVLHNRGWSALYIKLNYRLGRGRRESREP